MLKAASCYRADQRHAPQPCFEDCLKLCIGVAQGTSRNNVVYCCRADHRHAPQRCSKETLHGPHHRAGQRQLPKATTERYRAAQSRGTPHNNVLKTASCFRASQRHTRRHCSDAIDRAGQRHAPQLVGKLVRLLVILIIGLARKHSRFSDGC
jgi:hypothetical protein